MGKDRHGPNLRMSKGPLQGRTGIKNCPGQFPDDLPPYRPSPGKILKKLPKSPFSHVKMTFFTYTLPAHRAFIAQLQAWSIPG